jgi:predicted HTH transcriptional regulator
LSARTQDFRPDDEKHALYEMITAYLQRVEQLSGPQRSKPTNPLFAEAFHRTGAVEMWARGTTRVIAMCKQHGAAEPTFEEGEGFLIVTFKARVCSSA